ncbi:MAG: hypothetical protein MMC23_001842 [Stictis urceolatum]|nr:hypothetical protein [Stictis urceolata]
MAPKAAKAKSKTTTASSNATKAESGPPSPYSRAPPALQPFLTTLSAEHVYITHVDRHPAAFKRQIFMVPIALNIAIVALLVWRMIRVAPWYAYLLMTIWGYNTPYFVDPRTMSWNGILEEIIHRALPMVVDVTLATFIAPWPWDFFFGSPASPSSWRLRVGFRDQEVAVRRSRRWDQTLPKDWLAEEGDGAVYQERIMPAIDRQWVKAKTGYMMMDKSWDLDFQAMVKAHSLIESGESSIGDFEKQVIVHHDEFGWLLWPVWKLDEGAQDEGRRVIVEFKEKLTAMGKESLFFRWIEIIQYESSQPGGFTAERQAKAMAEAKSAFEEQGVDFDLFWEEVGGTKGMPGLA